MGPSSAVSGYSTRVRVVDSQKRLNAAAGLFATHINVLAMMFC
jgi:hypothetical protein